ncbi:antigen identified by monoclonal antibody Ki-67 [Mycoemilia scoparia]|uniref:Antigen identified by monoclonal antibody Ki-67 n=1 Tax=Mycoemilia scoparia TaxID=417184 RepID=A0A9W7ZY29_9FUNG|nr:antigen identified by monoclonal antibody Ki-67 [Mycoemilia scoparia]
MGKYGSIVVLKSSGADSKVFQMDRRECLFGRKDFCDIRIQVPQVSNEHCRIYITKNNRAYLSNLSINGTKVNDEDIAIGATRQLNHKDVLTVGTRRFRFEYPNSFISSLSSKQAERPLSYDSSINKSVSTATAATVADTKFRFDTILDDNNSSNQLSNNKYSFGATTTTTTTTTTTRPLSLGNSSNNIDDNNIAQSLMMVSPPKDLINDWRLSMEKRGEQANVNKEKPENLADSLTSSSTSKVDSTENDNENSNSNSNPDNSDYTKRIIPSLAITSKNRRLSVKNKQKQHKLLTGGAGGDYDDDDIFMSPQTSSAKNASDTPTNSFMKLLKERIGMTPKSENSAKKRSLKSGNDKSKIREEVDSIMKSILSMAKTPESTSPTSKEPNEKSESGTATNSMADNSDAAATSEDIVNEDNHVAGQQSAEIQHSEAPKGVDVETATSIGTPKYSTETYDPDNNIHLGTDKDDGDIDPPPQTPKGQIVNVGQTPSNSTALKSIGDNRGNVSGQQDEQKRLSPIEYFAKLRNSSAMPRSTSQINRNATPISAGAIGNQSSMVSPLSSFKTHTNGGGGSGGSLRTASPATTLKRTLSSDFKWTSSSSSATEPPRKRPMMSLHEFASMASIKANNNSQRIQQYDKHDRQTLMLHGTPGIRTRRSVVTPSKFISDNENGRSNKDDTLESISNQMKNDQLDFSGSETEEDNDDSDVVVDEDTNEERSIGSDTSSSFDHQTSSQSQDGDNNEEEGANDATNYERKTTSSSPAGQMVRRRSSSGSRSSRRSSMRRPRMLPAFDDTNANNGEEPTAPEFQSPTTGRKVRFGPPLSPELFDHTQPPLTPVKRGTPVHIGRQSSILRTSILRSSSIIINNSKPFGSSLATTSFIPGSPLNEFEQSSPTVTPKSSLSAIPTPLVVNDDDLTTAFGDIPADNTNNDGDNVNGSLQLPFRIIKTPRKLTRSSSTSSSLTPIISAKKQFAGNNNNAGTGLMSEPVNRNQRKALSQITSTPSATSNSDRISQQHKYPSTVGTTASKISSFSEYLKSGQSSLKTPNKNLTEKLLSLVNNSNKSLPSVKISQTPGTAIDNEPDSNESSPQNIFSTLSENQENAIEVRRMLLDQNSAINNIAGLSSPDFSGIKQLLKTPAQKLDPKLTGIREMFKTPTPKDYNESGNGGANKQPNYTGLKEMVKTPKPNSSSSSSNKYANYVGLKDLIKTPRIPKEINMVGIRELVKTPKMSVEADMYGLKEMVKTPKPIPEADMVGLREMVKTPKQAPEADMTGLKDLVKTPKAQPEPQFAGMRDLLKTPQKDPDPRFTGIKEMVKTPKRSTRELDLTGLKELVKTPKTQIRSQLDPDAFRKLLKTPHPPKTINHRGLRDLFMTPGAQPDLKTIEGLNRLFRSPDIVMDRESPTKNSNIDQTIDLPLTSLLDGSSGDQNSDGKSIQSPIPNSQSATKMTGSSTGLDSKDSKPILTPGRLDFAAKVSVPQTSESESSWSWNLRSHHLAKADRHSQNASTDDTDIGKQSVPTAERDNHLGKRRQTMQIVSTNKPNNGTPTPKLRSSGSYSRAELDYTFGPSQTTANGEQQKQKQQQEAEQSSDVDESVSPAKIPSIDNGNEKSQEHPCLSSVIGLADAMAGDGSNDDSKSNKADDDENDMEDTSKEMGYTEFTVLLKADDGEEDISLQAPENGNDVKTTTIVEDSPTRLERKAKFASRRHRRRSASDLLLEEQEQLQARIIKKPVSVLNRARRMTLAHPAGAEGLLANTKNKSLSDTCDHGHSDHKHVPGLQALQMTKSLSGELSAPTAASDGNSTKSKDTEEISSKEPQAKDANPITYPPPQYSSLSLGISNSRRRTDFGASSSSSVYDSSVLDSIGRRRRVSERASGGGRKSGHFYSSSQSSIDENDSQFEQVPLHTPPNPDEKQDSGHEQSSEASHSTKPQSYSSLYPPKPVPVDKDWEQVASPVTATVTSNGNADADDDKSAAGLQEWVHVEASSSGDLHTNGDKQPKAPETPPPALNRLLDSKEQQMSTDDMEIELGELKQMTSMTPDFSKIKSTATTPTSSLGKRKFVEAQDGDEESASDDDDSLSIIARRLAGNKAKKEDTKPYAAASEDPKEEDTQPVKRRRGRPPKAKKQKKQDSDNNAGGNDAKDHSDNKSKADIEDKKAQSSQHTKEDEEEIEDKSATEPRRRRGRPRKNNSVSSIATRTRSQSVSDAESATAGIAGRSSRTSHDSSQNTTDEMLATTIPESVPVAPKRRPGRPRKNSVVKEQSTSSTENTGQVDPSSHISTEAYLQSLPPLPPSPVPSLTRTKPALTRRRARAIQRATESAEAEEKDQQNNKSADKQVDSDDEKLSIVKARSRASTSKPKKSDSKTKSTDSESQTTTAATRRGRKVTRSASASVASHESEKDEEQETAVTTRRRGRPRKAESQSSTMPAAKDAPPSTPTTAGTSKKRLTKTASKESSDVSKPTETVLSPPKLRNGKKRAAASRDIKSQDNAAVDDDKNEQEPSPAGNATPSKKRKSNAKSTPIVATKKTARKARKTTAVEDDGEEEQKKSIVSPLKTRSGRKKQQQDVDEPQVPSSPKAKTKSKAKASSSSTSTKTKRGRKKQ